MTRSGERAARVDSGAVAYEFKLPDLGEGLTEGEIARWLVSEGQEIAEDEPLVEIQTDKTTVEIPSPAAGKVARILVDEGEVVPVGTVLVVIGEANGHDGEAAVDTMARIRVVAGPAFTDRLLWHLITAGLRRAATQSPTTRCCGDDRTATGH